MDMSLVDSLLETVFFGGEEGGLEDRPHPRFQWKPPVAKAAPPAGEEGMPDDRTGSVPMGQMLPDEEVATSDDLLDFFQKVKKAKGKSKKPLEKEFSAHRTEFESMLHKFVDKLLTEAVCGKCGQEVGDRYFADKARSGAKINVCGNCYMKDTEHEYTSGGHTEEFPSYEGATLSRNQVRGNVGQ
jgi:hypothetical protein